MSGIDVVDAAAGLAPDSRVATLRRQREAFVRHTQGSHDVLIIPAYAAGVSLIERAAAALRVATIEGDAALSAHYRSRLQEIGADVTTITAAEGGFGAAGVSPRLASILCHVDIISRTPSAADRAHLDALRDVDLLPRDIVVIAQIVAFVSYQARLVAGLRLLDGRAGG